MRAQEGKSCDTIRSDGYGIFRRPLECPNPHKSIFISGSHNRNNSDSREGIILNQTMNNTFNKCNQRERINQFDTMEIIIIRSIQYGEATFFINKLDFFYNNKKKHDIIKMPSEKALKYKIYYLDEESYPFLNERTHYFCFQRYKYTNLSITTRQDTFDINTFSRSISYIHLYGGIRSLNMTL